MGWRRYGVTDRQVIAMTVADMDFRAPPPVNEVVRAAAEHGIHGYFGGDEAMRQAVVSWMSSRHGWTPEPEWIRTCQGAGLGDRPLHPGIHRAERCGHRLLARLSHVRPHRSRHRARAFRKDRKSTRLNSSHVASSYAVFCLKKEMQTSVSCVGNCVCHRKILCRNCG